MACTITFVTINGIVPSGALNPSHLEIKGLLSCASTPTIGTVQITTNVTAPSGSITVGTTGAFFASLPITSALQCGDDRQKVNILITATCDGDTCTYSDSITLFCPGCFRAQVSHTTAPCVGGTQPITLNAVISIPAGQIYDFLWDPGTPTATLHPGSLPSSFQIDNSLGTAATMHNAPPVTFDYPPATTPYKARLQIVPPPNECQDVEHDVTAQCLTCPTVTGNVSVGQCETNSASPNYRHRPVAYTLTFSPPIPQGVATASVIFNYGGPNAQGNTSSGALPIPTSGGPVPSHFHTTYLKSTPSGYSSSATVVISGQGQTCFLNVSFDNTPTHMPPVVMVGACLDCPDNVTVTITTPTPTDPSWCVPLNGAATGVAQLSASVNWPPNAVNPPNAGSFDWKVTRPDGSQATWTNAPPNASGKSLVDTGSGWTGAGAKNGAVDLSLTGTYAVAATAKFPPSAGLPTNSDGTPACNLTGSDSFLLDACNPTVPPPCPSITLSVTSGGCFDPAVGTAVPIGFVASVVDPAGTSTGIDWNFGDPASGASNTLSPPPGTFAASHSYAAAGSFVVTAKVKHPTPCKQGSGSDTVATTVIVPTCPCPPGMTRNASGVCVPTTTTGTGTPGIGCIILLILALLNLVSGAVLVGIAKCAPPNPATPWLLGFGIAAMGVGLILLLLWGILCARLMCPVLNILAWTFSILVTTSAILAGILALTGNGPCAIGAAIITGEWGVALAITGWISGITGCRIFV